ncbi:MAG: hypothetical protein R3D51_08480 [Hyphomicrobiaceae bacterium]
MSKLPLLLASAFVAVSSCAVHAAELTAESITKAIEDVSNDANKLKAYCSMAAKMDEIGDDDKAAEAAGDEIDGYFKTLGPDFESAWSGAQEAPEDSPQAKAFEDAMTKLEEKCQK